MVIRDYAVQHEERLYRRGAVDMRRKELIGLVGLMPREVEE
jgi:hypothetical protein